MSRLDVYSSLDCIMHNDDTQDLDNLARLVHSPRRDLVHNMHPRREYNRLRMNSRDRSRRT